MGEGLILVSLVFSLIAFVFSVVNYIDLKAQQKSTHNIQMVPIDDIPKDAQGFEILTEKGKEKLENDEIEL